jgi:iron complex transport system substrate-binding protein
MGRKALPETGRGTIRRTVEGGPCERSAGNWAPSVSPLRRAQWAATSPFRGGFALALLLTLAACTHEPPPSPSVHPTIVSLNPCTDAVLAEVAAPGQLLAISHYSHDPRASSMDLAVARRFAATGGTAEEVLALKPDLVIAGSYLPPATRQAFTRLGLRVETLGAASTIAESEAQVRQLAALSENPERGEALIVRIEAALAAARPPTGGHPPDTLLWEEGGIVAGPDSLAAELLRRTGFANHSAARGLGQGAYLPLELVLADPPDLILTDGDERALAHPALKAIEHTRYARLDPALLYCGGPTIVRLAGRLAAIRGELAE